MAQAAKSSRDIIDLTGDDDSVARADAAYERAFAAASRLTNHFESLKTSKPIAYQSPNENVDRDDKNALSATLPQPLMRARLGTFPMPPRFEKPGPKMGVKNNDIPRRNSSSNNPGVSASQSALGIAASRPPNSPSTLRWIEGRTQEPRETTSATPKTDNSTIRTPRSAAISAKQNITETYSELEEWVNKDTNLIPQHTGVSTTRRPGRPDEDLEEWSPSRNTNVEQEEWKGLGKRSTSSPIPLAGKHEELIAKGEKSLSLAQGGSIFLGTKKRKLSGSSQSRASPAKVTRWNEGPNTHHESNPPISAEPANGRHVPYASSTASPSGGVFPKCVYPAIKSARAKYKQSLTEDDLTVISKSITNDIMRRGVDAFCPASAHCPKDQRTEMILKSVSENFDERAIRVRNGSPIDLIASTDSSRKEIKTPLFEHKASPLERNSSGKGTIKINDKPLPQQPPNTESGKNGASTKPTMLQTQENIHSRLQPAFHVASNPTTSEPGLSSASPGHSKYAALFNSVVYPSIKKSKKRHKNSLPQEDLSAIAGIIIDEVLKRLASHSEDPTLLDEDTHKKIKHFVKKSFRQKVRKANTQSSHNSATPANESRPGIATHSSGSSGLGGTTRTQLILTGDHRPPALGSEHFENTLSSRAIAGNEEEEAEAPQKSHPQPLDQELSLSLPNSPNESPTSPFGPNFDRGRFPAQRRRRGNKFYAPTKASKTTVKAEKGYSIPSKHDNHLGVSSGKDHVRLLKALANQSTNLSGSMTHSTALTTVPEKKATPTSQGQVLDSWKDFAASQSVQQNFRKTLLEDIYTRKELQPTLRPQPASALDPHLEYVLAILVSETSMGPSQDEQKYSITPKNRKQLVTNESILKHVDLTAKVGKPKLVRIETKVIDPERQPGRCISSLLRHRELGLTSRGRHVGTIRELSQLNSEMIEPWKNWKGASGDVVAIAWSRDSNVYAFGAAAHTNVEDIQYNRPCNLLLGNLASNQIRELPDHRVDRPKPETIPSGPNANQAVYDACDPKVYETVTSIAFSPTGEQMFTASHDCTVKIWDVSAGKSQCVSTLRHEAWVTSVEVSEHHQGVFATASKCVKNAIRIYHDSSCHGFLSASRAETRPEWRIYPECLRWGPNHHTSHLLLAGFQQWEQQGDLISGGGQLCLWDAIAFTSIKVTPSSQSVYAAAWHPTEPFFATGGAPGNNLIDKINTKTVVRIWDVRTPKRCHVEYECPATDMQDITFSPLNSNIVTAGCTDGISYVWDWRWPDQLLHRLKHGRPLAELDHTREREEADTGVMLSLWGPSGSLFYTGSSDGKIKAWDVRRHPNDVLISNVADFDVGIQSGAFSPDGNNLLVGDAEGGIHVLSSAPCGPRSNFKSTDEYIELVRASDGSGSKVDQKDENPGTEGIEAARSLVESGQLEYHKELGIGQGPNYSGPYATYARKETDESTIGRLRKKFEKKQPISKRGEKRWDIAIPMTSLLYERKETLDRERDADKRALNDLKERKLEATSQRSKDGETLQTSPFSSKAEETVAVGHASVDKSLGATSANGNVEYNTLSESEMVEENYWWARMGEEEIDQARAGRMK